MPNPQVSWTTAAILCQESSLMKNSAKPLMTKTPRNVQSKIPVARRSPLDHQ
jgi:hypothetical protein